MASSPNYRAKCFEEKGEECAECGSTDNIHVHHADGDRDNNDIENLIPLCKDCHWDQHRDEVAARASGPRDGWGPTTTNAELNPDEVPNKDDADTGS